MRTIFAALVFLFAPAGSESLDLVPDSPPLAEGVVLQEGMRGIGDIYPYLEFRHGAARGRDLRPETLEMACPSIRNEKEALAAVRLFIAGPLVRDKARAELVIRQARDLKKELKHLRLEIADYRPGVYEPVVTPVDGGFRVGLVAFEMDRMLRLVHVDATVKRNGEMKLERKAIVDGPMTVWQSASIGGADDGRIDGEMRKEALFAREAFARVLMAKRDVDTAFVIARLRLTPEQVSHLWGEQSRIVGSGVRLVAYDLEVEGAVVFDATVPTHPIQRLRQVKEAKPGLGKREVLRRFSVGR